MCRLQAPGRAEPGAGEGEDVEARLMGSPLAVASRADSQASLGLGSESEFGTPRSDFGTPLSVGSMRSSRGRTGSQREGVELRSWEASQRDPFK